MCEHEYRGDDNEYEDYKDEYEGDQREYEEGKGEYYGVQKNKTVSMSIRERQGNTRVNIRVRKGS